MSFAESLSTYGRSCRFVVADGSLDSATQQANREGAQVVQRKFGFEMCLMGGHERKALFDHFVGAGLDPEVVKFALFGLESFRFGMCGANRNLSLALMTTPIVDLLLQM
jgi:hypothetical protein